MHLPVRTDHAGAGGTRYETPAIADYGDLVAMTESLGSLGLEDGSGKSIEVEISLAVAIG